MNKTLHILLFTASLLYLQTVKADLPHKDSENYPFNQDNFSEVRDSFFKKDYSKVEYHLLPFHISGSGYVTDEYNRNYRIKINPESHYYFENGNLIKKFDTEVYTNYTLSRAYSDYQQKAFTVNKLDFNIKLKYSDQRYFSRDDRYYQYAFSPDFAVYNTRNSDDDVFDRSIGFNSGILLGMGKIRDVTAKIRTLKFRERYQKLTKQSTLQDNSKIAFTRKELQEIAAIFNNLKYYNSRYDRPLRHIWQDLREVLGEKLEGIDTFDIIYLSEVIEQYMHRRKEGWTLAGGFLFNLHDLHEKLPADPYEADFQQFGAILTGSWSRILSIDKQLSFLCETSLSRKFYPGYETDFLNVKLEQEFLWNIWDRLTDVFKVEANFEYNISEKDNREDIKRFNLPVIFSNSFEYLIEDRLNFFFNQTLTYSYNYEPGYRSKDYYHEAKFSFSFGLKYDIK